MDTRVLLVEDEEHLIDAIKLNLEVEGMVVKVAENGKKAIDLYNEQRFDLVVLDIMLPYVDGLKVCEYIRLNDQKIPILMLSAKGTAADRVNGLKSGADDYLTKPFDLEEFLLRVQLLLKRSALNPINLDIQTFSFGENFIDFITYEYKGVNGQNGKLSAKENKLLKLLIEKKNEVVSRDYILELVWGVDIYPSTRTIDNFILSFRKYFEDDPKNPQYFHSIRGVGYKFTN
ncbi:MAG: hypothetical protein RLZZ414_1444 [Bacteroidota bacterium]|jgi:two-component system alkaline phosphatase synthesis response regulator PhoP